MERRSFFALLGKGIAAAALAANLKLGELCPVLPAIETATESKGGPWLYHVFSIDMEVKADFPANCRVVATRQLADGQWEDVSFNTSIAKFAPGDTISIEFPEKEVRLINGRNV